MLGYSRLFGNGKHDGEEEFEYGVALSYTITREQLRIPGVRQISPLLEAQGDLGLNLGEAGSNDLLGSAGFRMDFKNIGELQPSIGLAYLFPMTSDAREEVHWGIVASFTVRVFFEEGGCHWFLFPRDSLSLASIEVRKRKTRKSPLFKPICASKAVVPEAGIEPATKGL